jgi:hypothetical protein
MTLTRARLMRRGSRHSVLFWWEAGNRPAIKGSFRSQNAFGPPATG